MGKLKRKTIVCEKVFEKYDLEGNLDHAIDLLTNLRKEVGGDAFLSINSYKSYDGYINTTIDVVWRRPETDQEYEKRCRSHYKRSAAARKAHAAQKEKKEKEERELFLKLKAKYEGK